MPNAAHNTYTLKCEEPLIRANKKVPAIIAIEAMVAIIKDSLSKPLKLRELDIDAATDLLAAAAGLAAELLVVGLAVAGLLVLPRLGLGLAVLRGADVWLGLWVGLSAGVVGLLVESEDEKLPVSSISALVAVVSYQA